MKSVSPELLSVINDLMKEPLINDFYLGGGTNLALKYNHRVSTDIDLFSSKIVGLKTIENINNLLVEKYKHLDISTSIENKTNNQLAFIKASFEINDIGIKIDIIQNLPLNNAIEVINGVRLINDLDIGALKLLAASDRGNRKDFYDIYLLSKKYGLKTIYDELMIRNKLFDSNKIEYQNIFNIPTVKPKELLETSITKLGDFNNANDLKNAGNRIKLNKDSPTLIVWSELKKEFTSMLKKLALQEKVEFKPTEYKRRKRGLGF